MTKVKPTLSFEMDDIIRILETCDTEEKNALLVTNSEHYEFLYPELQFFKELYYCWWGVDANYQLVINGAFPSLYSCPLWQFLSRYNITLGDFLANDYKIPEDVRFTDFDWKYVQSQWSYEEDPTKVSRAHDVNNLQPPTPFMESYHHYTGRRDDWFGEDDVPLLEERCA